MAPRVTNQDLSERLIRLEEKTNTSALASGDIKDRLDKMVTWTESSIRLQGRVDEHDGKLSRLFTKTDNTDADVKIINETTIPRVESKADRVINYGSAIIGTLSVVGGLLMACGVYFINQQGVALQSVAETTRQTAQSIAAIDRRLTVAEYQLGSLNVPHPVTPGVEPRKGAPQ